MPNSDLQDRQPELIFGFLCLRETEVGIRCGLLITDASGAPKEFRATEPPVRPTILQRILYGASLYHEIARLAGGPIIRAVEHTPSWIFAERPELLSLGTPSVPVVLLKPYGEELEVELGSDNAGDVAEQCVLTVGGGAFRPITVSFSSSVPDQEHQKLRTQLTALASSIALDLVEPFDRVRQALDVLDRQPARDGDR